MPIDSAHPLYSRYENQWTRCRDCVDGTDAIKDAGLDYLPALSGQTTDEYNAYKARAEFVGISARALSGLLGMVIRRSPTIAYPAKISYMFTDTIQHDTFSEIFQFAVSELLLEGRVGGLVDVTLDSKLYVSKYTTESILNWQYDDNGRLVLLMLVESVTVQDDERDPYSQASITQYRELYLEDEIFKYKVHRKNERGVFEVYEQDVYTVRGQTIDFIPFVCVNLEGLSLEPSKPPMLDIVDVNLSHYRTSADLENGRHFVALPTPVVTGVADADINLRIGSETAWILPSKDAKAFYLEFLGQGLLSLENALKHKEAQMAQFSARLLDLSSKGSEAAETVRLRYSSESANLTTVARVVERFLTSIYQVGAILAGADPNQVEIDLNKEFIDTKMSFQELRELTKSFLEGAISREVFTYNLARGELLPPESGQGE